MMAGVFLVAICCAYSWRAIGVYFAVDDIVYLAYAQHLSWPGFSSAAAQRWLSGPAAFRLCTALFGTNAAFFHFPILLGHAANTLLLWQLLRRVVPAHPGLALTSSALFGMHAAAYSVLAWLSAGFNECFVATAALGADSPLYRRHATRFAALGDACSSCDLPGHGPQAECRSGERLCLRSQCLLRIARARLVGKGPVASTLDGCERSLRADCRLVVHCCSAEDAGGTIGRILPTCIYLVVGDGGLRVVSPARIQSFGRRSRAARSSGCVSSQPWPAVDQCVGRGCCGCVGCRNLARCSPPRPADVCRDSRGCCARITRDRGNAPPAPV